MSSPATTAVAVPGVLGLRAAGTRARSPAYPSEQNSSAATNHMMENSVSPR